MTLMGQKFYVIGGKAKDKEVGSIQIFDISKKQWTTSKVKGEISVYGHSAVAYNGKIYIFGGKSSKGVTNGLIAYDPFADTMSEVISSGVQPDPRHGHSAVLFRDFMVIYGGKAEKEMKGDLWFFDIEKLEWRKGGEFPKRYLHHAFVFGNEMVVIGGLSSDKYHSIAIKLEGDCKSADVADVGNVPVELNSFAGVQLNDHEMVVYGGKEYRMSKPVNGVYKLRLNALWAENMAKIWKPVRIWPYPLPVERTPVVLVRSNPLLFSKDCIDKPGKGHHDPNHASLENPQPRKVKGRRTNPNFQLPPQGQKLEIADGTFRTVGENEVTLAVSDMDVSESAEHEPKLEIAVTNESRIDMGKATVHMSRAKSFHVLHQEPRLEISLTSESELNCEKPQLSLSRAKSSHFHNEEPSLEIAVTDKSDISVEKASLAMSRAQSAQFEDTSP